MSSGSEEVVRRGCPGRGPDRGSPSLRLLAPPTPWLGSEITRLRSLPTCPAGSGVGTSEEKNGNVGGSHPDPGTSDPRKVDDPFAGANTVKTSAYAACLTSTPTDRRVSKVTAMSGASLCMTAGAIGPLSIGWVDGPLVPTLHLPDEGQWDGGRS